LLVVLGCGILPVLRGDAPVGGDRTAYGGIDALAAYLNADLRGEVVYDHWLGWQLAYYLGEHPAVTLRYQPQPEALADEMAACACQRYLAAPLTPQLAPWLNALARADVSIRQIYCTPGGHFAVYRLAPAIHD
jgi:hypothetical protein